MSEVKSKHTPEPWRVEFDEQGSAQLRGFVHGNQSTHGRFIAWTTSHVEENGLRAINAPLGPREKANLNRIIQCVNAMAGVREPAKLVEEHREMRKALGLIREAAICGPGFGRDGEIKAFRDIRRIAGEQEDRITAREEGEKA